MKIGDRYLHQIDQKALGLFSDSIGEISVALTSCPYRLTKGSSQTIKKDVTCRLNSFGWVSNVQVDNRLNATVNCMKFNVAFAFQLGNFARIYADTLKLAHLDSRGVTKLGIIALACKKESQDLGSNHASFERFVTELQVYELIVQNPILVLGLTN